MIIWLVYRSTIWSLQCELAHGKPFPLYFIYKAMINNILVQKHAPQHTHKTLILGSGGGVSFLKALP